LADFQANEDGYGKDWEPEQIVAAFNTYKGNNENLDSGEWVQLCERIRTGWIPEGDVTPVPPPQPDPIEEKCNG
jgi:hypothetical protein